MMSLNVTMEIVSLKAMSVMGMMIVGITVMRSKIIVVCKQNLHVINIHMHVQSCIQHCLCNPYAAK